MSSRTANTSLGFTPRFVRDTTASEGEVYLRKAPAVPPRVHLDTDGACRLRMTPQQALALARALTEAAATALGG